MEDVLTEAPPPSRISLEDLNNFSPKPPNLPLPILALKDFENQILTPNLLVIAISKPSVQVIQSINPKTLVGGLILPETSYAGNSLEPSINDKSCNIYALASDPSTYLISVQCDVNEERCNAVAKALIGNRISPKNVLILDSIKSRIFRGKLPPDETFAFKLETMAERRGSHPHLVCNVGYFPSGSLVDGLAAMLLIQCQLKNIRGTLLLTWPVCGGSSLSLIMSLLCNNLPSDIRFMSHCDTVIELPKDFMSKDKSMESDLYT